MAEQLLHNAVVDNIQCADCRSEPVTHISVQNGVTLCSDCATVHSRFLHREAVSWVRPIVGVTWREDHL